MFQTGFRIDDAKRAFVNRMPKMGVFLVMVVALIGCATTKPGPNETIITDSTTLRTVQRLVAVSVPGDSAGLRTRLVLDPATGQFKPVVLYTRSAHSLLTVSLDAFGLLTVSNVRGPYVAQTPVTDTERSSSRSSQRREEVLVKAPPSGFVKFSVWFTVLSIVLTVVLLYLKFFTPLRLIK